jgi:hypothetical protein
MILVSCVHRSVHKPTGRLMNSRRSTSRTTDASFKKKQATRAAFDRRR